MQNKNSFALLSIPYDKGFTIYVDGKEKEYEIVNNGFIGFKLEKGIHRVEIRYNSPLFKEGSIISICSLIVFSILCINKSFKIEVDKKKKNTC